MLARPYDFTSGGWLVRDDGERNARDVQPLHLALDEGIDSAGQILRCRGRSAVHVATESSVAGIRIDPIGHLFEPGTGLILLD